MEVLLVKSVTLKESQMEKPLTASAIISQLSSSV